MDEVSSESEIVGWGQRVDSTLTDSSEITCRPERGQRMPESAGHSRDSLVRDVWVCRWGRFCGQLECVEICSKRGRLSSPGERRLERLARQQAAS